MKIGILSMQRIINHGSFWQAYLLKKMLTDAGHSVEFIDIEPGRKLYEYPKRKIRFGYRNLRRLYYRLIFVPRRKRIMEQAQTKYLQCSSVPNYSTDYDRIIIGSDEVFNFAQMVPWGFSVQLHGMIDNNHVSSYAASFGASTYADVQKYGVKDELVSAMSNLKRISVRDENSYIITKKLLPDAMVYRHLDPVLVGDLPMPERHNVRKKYILVYAYNYRFKDEAYIKSIKEFAAKHHYRVYGVGFCQSWTDRDFNVDPYELLQYFINAEYVVTDTFHGTIFSVRCHKKFVTVIREGSNGNKEKLSSLLKALHLEYRQLINACDFEEILTSEINYSDVDDVLKSERERTDTYLNMCIKGD